MNLEHKQKTRRIKRSKYRTKFKRINVSAVQGITNYHKRALQILAQTLYTPKNIIDRDANEHRIIRLRDNQVTEENNDRADVEGIT